MLRQQRAARRFLLVVVAEGDLVRSPDLESSGRLGRSISGLSLEYFYECLQGCAFSVFKSQTVSSNACQNRARGQKHNNGSDGNQLEVRAVNGRVSLSMSIRILEVLTTGRCILMRAPTLDSKATSESFQSATLTAKQTLSSTHFHHCRALQL